jgi:TIR domain/CHASE2 domain
VRGFLNERIPDWAPKTAALVLVYLVVMLALTVWMPVWHDMDVRFFQWLAGTRASTLSTQISLVDVTSWDTGNIPANRKTLAAFLTRLAQGRQHPKAVVLDFSFGQSVSGNDPAWTSARDSLVRALQTAAGAGIDVYATEEVPVDANDDVMAAPAALDAAIYAHLAGAAHTGFTIVPGSRFLFYRVCYAPAGGLSHDVWSMVSRILPDFDASQGCDTEHRPVLVGPPISQAPPAVYSITAATPFPSGADFGGKYVIVGTLRNDRPQYAERSGPELVAWALTDALARQGSMISLQTYYEAKPQNGMLLLLVPVFSGLTVLAFTACFFLVRRLRLGGGRRFLPWIASLGALCAGIAALAVFESWMLMSHEIQPQVSLISLGMLVAAMLCGVRGNQIVFAESNTIDAAPQEKYDYDVFISYAHEEGAWVFEHVYAPFRDAALGDGRKLSIFFDTAEIRVGTAWQDKISLAIDGTRFIVPVYSDVYFQKPYCRFEVKRAHRKWITAGEQSRCVLPIMRGHPKILETVDDIQAASIDDDPQIVQKIIAEITARLAVKTEAVP